jgi:hypothetical protein
MKLLKIIRSKLAIFIIQFVILSLVLILFSYSFDIEFDSTISVERKWVIQVLANFIMFESDYQTFFIYVLWLMVSTLPILLYMKAKKAYSMNLITFFFPNFFFYVFLSRYSPIYFNENLGQLLFRTIILGFVLITYSIGFSLVLSYVWKITRKKDSFELQEIEKKVVSDCPNCGTHFDSRPEFCYNCNAKLIDEGENPLKNS